MVVIFYKNVRRKILASLMVVFLWAAIYYGSGIIFQNIFIINLTVGNLFTFSCPPSFEINNVFINNSIDDAITVSSNLAEPNSQKFSTYSSIKGKFSFKYPSIFTLSEQEFSGSEILYHIDFSDSQNIIHGLVQVWNIPYSLKDFLNHSKETSIMQFKNFKSTEVKIDDKDGYLWDYIVTTYYKALEYFFEKYGRIYRISMFSPESQWSKSDESIFWQMVKSFKIHTIPS
jgi:hypothetical protein